MFGNMLLTTWVLMAGVATQPAVTPKIALSEPQARALAEEIMLHTPEQVHWEKGTKFNWVLFDRQSDDPAPMLTALVLELLRKKYVVYLSEGAVPKDKMTVDGGLILWDGFRFSFELRRLDDETIEVIYSDYENPLGASSQTIKYKWERIKWQTVSKGPLIVSDASPNPALQAPSRTPGRA